MMWKRLFKIKARTENSLNILYESKEAGPVLDGFEPILEPGEQAKLPPYAPASAEALISAARSVS